MGKKIVLVIILISGFSVCQSKKLDDLQPYFIAITVSNIDTSIAWYENNFRAKLLNRAASQERGLNQANLKGPGLLIELVKLNSSISKEEIKKQFGNKGTQSFTKFGFKVKDFDGWYSYLKNKKVKFIGHTVRDDLTGKRMFLISDHDGNIFQIFEE
jgi:uncharacterized glyoxalase superfamily protein PhnB